MGEPKNRVGRIKSVVVGAAGVGKSSLTHVLSGDSFIQEYTPTIEDNYWSQFLVNGHEVLMEILDTPGEEEFPPVTEQCIRTGNAFVLVYSITDQASFDEVEHHHWGLILKCKDRKSFCAAEGAVLACIMSMQSGHEVHFIETSAKLNVNVTTAFARLAHMDMQRQDLVVKNKEKGTGCLLS
ncbi:Ras subfamily protein [Acanthamoeba castellanii str. Neff]|uniref:Ras subfamily protein n=1 Tax=Acanthamoeba castellanii (strain ATCC 30010 / Neff) TaxID=1257118 RepID=L8HGC2_ACACF|nr:Ras subfamily protein [Acanthamoeba castellanii str. Neff]ELR24185.1 Ras subfamily protein [Acanthamoeba castellanii str. Neff]